MKINKDRFNLALANSCMTISDLQNAGDISSATLSRIQSGTCEPRPKTIGKIAKALGVTAEYLIEGSGQIHES